MKDYQTNKRKDSIKKDNDILFYILKWLLIVALVYFSLKLITKPLRKNWSADYLDRANTYLEQKKYLTAELEYKKALYLFSSNKEARNNLELAEKAETDVTLLSKFYKERKLNAKAREIDSAKEVPETPAVAVKRAKELVEAGECQIAILSSQVAVEMDKSYQDGWKYLAISNLCASQQAEISESSRQKFSEQVQAAKSHLAEIPEILK